MPIGSSSHASPGYTAYMNAARLCGQYYTVDTTFARMLAQGVAPNTVTIRYA